MEAIVMALLAQPWRSNPEHSHIVAPVRHVAVQAVFSHGRVLPQEWPTLVGVAAEAVFVNAVLRDQLLGDGPVDVVASGALELPLPDRHV